MKLFQARVSSIRLFILGTLIISLNLGFFLLQNTQRSTLTDEKHSHVNLQKKQNGNSNGSEDIQMNNETHLDRKQSSVSQSDMKNRTIWKTIPPGTQMGERQVAALRKVIQSVSNVLVWGLGNDSPFWHDSTRGKVVFIEPAGFWYDRILKKYPYLEAYTVKYTTETVKSFDKYINSPNLWSELDIRSQLPAVITQTHWNVIIVDAPPGYKGAPGRYQSIYSSSLLARNNTHIFVDDFERKVEKEFSKKMLGTPVAVVKRNPKGIIGANEQAHFIHIKR